MLEVYLSKRYPMRPQMRSLEVTLVDDPTLSLGVAYPELSDAAAIAQSDCEGANGELFCSVGVGLGEAGDELDMVVTAALAYAIQEFHRPKSRQDWEAQSAWDWSVFTPLIEDKEGAWHSNCLTLSAS